MINGEAFSSIDFVGQCLVDKERTQAFEQEISGIQNLSEKTVLDIGTGSGVLALIAARCGAKKVYAIEYDPFVAAIAQKNIDLNKFNSVIEILHGDARTLSLSGLHFDVVIAEMLTTGLVEEHQVEAMNNLQEQGVVDENTIFLPSKQSMSMELVSYNNKQHGVSFDFPVHLWKWHDWSDFQIQNMSENKEVSTVFLNKINSMETILETSLKIIGDGEVNGLIIRGKTHFPSGAIIEDTEALNAPILLPINPQNLKIGDSLKFKLSYSFGKGFDFFKIDI